MTLKVLLSVLNSCTVESIISTLIQKVKKDLNERDKFYFPKNNEYKTKQNKVTFEKQEVSMNDTDITAREPMPTGLTYGLFPF